MALPQGLKTSLNKYREISSDIYQKYIPVIEDNTDIGTFASPILSVPEVYNEFVGALINRIVDTQIEVKSFNNPLRGLEGSVMPLGYANQDVFVNPSKATQFNVNDTVGLLQKYESDVKVQYLVKNMDLQYKVSVERTKLKEAFVSWEALDRFISALSQSLYNGMYIDEYRYTKALVSSAYKNNGVIVETISTSPTASEDAAKAFVTKAREYFLNFQAPSTAYNSWAKVGGAGKPVTTWSNPDDIVIMIRNDIRSYLDVNQLAGAFNIEYAKLLGNIYTVDNFDVYSDEGEKVFDGSNIYGILCDRNFFKIKPMDQFMEEFYNPNNRMRTFFLNNIKLYEYSLFANAVIFASGEATVNPTGFKFLVGGEEKTSITITEATDVEVVTTPYAANASITYASSATGKATVAKKANANKVITITPVADGSSNITATVGDVVGTLAVTVDV
jgi:hypothetical protein